MKSLAYKDSGSHFTHRLASRIGDDDVIVVADCLDRCASRRNLDSLSNVAFAQVCTRVYVMMVAGECDRLAGHEGIVSASQL